jgi:hypothetical protein
MLDKTYSNVSNKEIETKKISRGENSYSYLLNSLPICAVSALLGCIAAMRITGDETTGWIIGAFVFTAFTVFNIGIEAVVDAIKEKLG